MKRAAGKGASGLRIIAARHQLNTSWDKIKFTEIRNEAVADGYAYQVTVGLSGVDPALIAVELYAEGIDGQPAENIKMTLLSAAEATGETIYAAQVPAKRPATDYTARIIPEYEGIAVPLEDGHILWQR